MLCRQNNLQKRDLYMFENEIIVTMFEDEPEIDIREVATRELGTLNNPQLFQMFQFYYQVNREVANITTPEKFEACLEAFDRNPFRAYNDTKYRTEIINNLLEYTIDYDSLIVAAHLLKNDYSVDELIDNYYAGISAFDSNLF